MADELPLTEGISLTSKEAKANLEDIKEEEQLRTIIADTYVFVRSAEINKTIASFTFDHYIDEAKRQIKEDRILRSALNPEGVGKRPSKLAALEKLEADFTSIYDKAKIRAEAKDGGDVRDETVAPQASNSGGSQ